MKKYLLATGDLNGGIHKSLDLVVTDGHLNDVAIHHDPDWNRTTDFFLKKKNTNPLDVVYKDLAKFNEQNSVIGSLLTQIKSSKLTLKGMKKVLDKA